MNVNVRAGGQKARTACDLPPPTQNIDWLHWATRLPYLSILGRSSLRVTAAFTPSSFFPLSSTHSTIHLHQSDVVFFFFLANSISRRNTRTARRLYSYVILVKLAIINKSQSWVNHASAVPMGYSNTHPEGRPMVVYFVFIWTAHQSQHADRRPIMNWIRKMGDSIILVRNVVMDTFRKFPNFIQQQCRIPWQLLQCVAIDKRTWYESRA